MLCIVQVWGGGVHTLAPRGKTILRSCTLHNNSCEHEGGAIYARASSLQLHECTLSSNQALNVKFLLYSVLIWKAYNEESRKCCCDANK